jgi:hypothetical protein
MSVVRIAGDGDHCEAARRRQLLAMPGVRRRFERGSREDAGTTAVALRSTDVVRHLRELVAALDRRVPDMERAGEAAITRDAEALKRRALARISELEAAAALLRPATAVRPH